MLTVLILATNEAEDLPDCLASLKGLNAPIIVIDGGSTDATTGIAIGFGARVFRRPFDNFASQRAYGLSQVKTPWVLSLDSDERLSDDLVHEINGVLSNPACDGYTVPFQVEFMGRLMRFSGLGSEKHLRLFKKDKIDLSDGHSVHELYELKSRSQGALTKKIIHRPYRGLSEYLKKCDFYAELYAKDFVRSKGKLSWRYKAVPFYEFMRCYILNLGFLDAFPGLVWASLSTYHRQVRLNKIRKLLENA